MLAVSKQLITTSVNTPSFTIDHNVNLLIYNNFFLGDDVINNTSTFTDSNIVKINAIIANEFKIHYCLLYVLI